MTAANRRSPLLVAVGVAFVLLWLVLAAFPFVWTLWGSFKVQGDFFSKADWTYAIHGVRTMAETGSTFTGNLSWIPYVIIVVVACLLIGLVVLRIVKRKGPGL